MAGKKIQKRTNPRGNQSQGGMPMPHMQLGQQGKGTGRPKQQIAGAPGWAQRGYDSKAAQQSVTRQYGLTRNDAGDWVKPDMAFFTRQMEANGWGPQAQAGALNEQGTPVAIGGDRWLIGKNGLNYTGERAQTDPSALPETNAAIMAQTGYNRPYTGRLRRRGGTTGGMIY